MEENAPISDEEDNILVKLKKKQLEAMGKLNSSQVLPKTRKTQRDKEFEQRESSLKEREDRLIKKTEKYKAKKHAIKSQTVDFQKAMLDTQIKRIERLTDQAQSQAPLEAKIASLVEDSRRLVQVKQGGKKIWKSVIDNALKDS